MTKVTAQGASAGNVAYAYDQDLRVASRSINGAPVTSYAYDNDGLVTAAGPLGFTWDPTNGYLTATTVGGATATTTSHAYNVWVVKMPVTPAELRNRIFSTHRLAS